MSNFGQKCSINLTSRISTLVEFASPLDQCARTTSVRAASSLPPNTKSMSLRLQSVQQYTNKGNWQLYRFNNIPTIKLQWSFLEALSSSIVYSRRPEFRQDQARDCLSEECQSDYRKSRFNQNPKYFEIRLSQPRSFENFGGGSEVIKKLLKTKP